MFDSNPKQLAQVRDMLGGMCPTAKSRILDHAWQAAPHTVPTWIRRWSARTGCRKKIAFGRGRLSRNRTCQSAWMSWTGTALLRHSERSSKTTMQSSIRLPRRQLKGNYAPIVKEAPMGGLWRKCLWQGCQSQAYRDVFTASSGADYP